MANKSRGSIEEGSIAFANETEKTIIFSAVSKGGSFNSPPAVKLTSVDSSGSGNGNANIGVTFSNITTTGMKVITTAPFTGEIRYLCSVQG
tara:strand:+ start:24207 stop:24479 length:273 start_codon:yes stop_codon:yes gene_type:complete